MSANDATAAAPQPPDPLAEVRARETVALRVLLGMDAPPADFAGIGVARAPSASQFALLIETRNEWALCIPVEQMSNKQLATLAWLYIQSRPAAEIARHCYGEAGFDLAKFHAAVLEWADRTDPKTKESLFSIAMLGAATAYIARIMGMKSALDYDIEEKPVKPGEKPPPVPPAPPPN